MSASKRALTVFLASMCGIASAQSIDELSDLNRQAMLADARAKLDKKKDLPAAAPNGLPAGAPGIAGAPPATGAPKRPSVQKPPPAPPPALVAIYGVGGRLITELNDRGFESKYREGDRTQSGWTVSRIERRQVAMTRPQKTGNGVETVFLPFGVKLDDTKEKDKEKEVTMTPGTGFSMPPIPPSFPTLMK